ncbi:collagen alpha-2(I) chain-like [Equus asinus]|uniref:collagen alpha-2(I) chain-like n=1 Tax=Equus asinus TaxID=9793 RepID=UPI0038F5E4E2
MLPGAWGPRRGSRCTSGTAGRCRNQCPQEPRDGGTAACEGRLVQRQPLPPAGFGAGVATSGAWLAPAPGRRARLRTSPGYAQWPFADAATEPGRVRNGGPAGSRRGRVGLPRLSQASGRGPWFPWQPRGGGERELRPRDVPAGFGGCRPLARRVAPPPASRDTRASPSSRSKAGGAAGPRGPQGPRLLQNHVSPLSRVPLKARILPTPSLASLAGAQEMLKQETWRTADQHLSAVIPCAPEDSCECLKIC